MKALIRLLTIIVTLFSLSCAIITTPVFADEPTDPTSTETPSGGGEDSDDNAGDSKNPNIKDCSCPGGGHGTRPNTAIIGNRGDSSTGCECGGGESIMSILKFVVDIMSIGVGILGVIGISITGIQYLTAGGNEEQVRKAKRRMFEIVIGLAAYAVAAALLSWLLPGFTGGGGAN